MKRGLALAVVALLSRDGATSRRFVSTPSNPGAATALILERDEGERRVWRPLEGALAADAGPGLFILKVDPHNGGSAHLVLGTEDLPRGAKIDQHRHPGSDEILLLQNGNARVTVGTASRDVQGGATVFIPANTWINVANTGDEVIHLVFVFSAPGFERFMRAESVPEGQPATPLTKEEDAAIQRRFEHAVIYRTP